MRILILLSVMVVSAACGGQDAANARVEDARRGPACDWQKIFGTPSNGGKTCSEIVGLTKLAEITQDDDWAAEVDSNGFLQVHEGSPLYAAGLLIVPSKSGFVDPFDQATVHYAVKAWRISPTGQPTLAWQTDTDWQPFDAVVEPFANTNGYVQQFQPVVAAGSVLVPALHGQLLKLDLSTGAVQARINPFAGTPFNGDSRLTVTNALTAGADGAVYYAAVAWPVEPDQFGRSPRGSWLVRVKPSGLFQIADWSPDNTVRLGTGEPIATPLVGVPRLNDLCQYPFGTGGTPQATGPDSQPPQFRCGAQRPAMNAAFAISPTTGNLVVYSYANNARAAAFLIEVDHNTLQPVLHHAADLRDNHLRYGCGVRLSLSFPGCSILTNGGTANIGADPQFNGNIRLRTPADIMNNSPSITPDGQFACIGSYDGGFSFGGQFDARGAMLCYRVADGSFFSQNDEFGWEVTESWMPTATGYVGLQDRNLYSLFHLGVATYDPDFTFRGTAEAPPILFGDFVDNEIAFDTAGNQYAVAESGIMYKRRGSSLIEAVQLTSEPIEVLSGHIARSQNFLFPSYAGRVFVVGSDGSVNATSGSSIAVPPQTAKMRMARGFSAENTPDPGPPSD